jgi:site-specific recombinase XerD
METGGEKEAAEPSQLEALVALLAEPAKVANTGCGKTLVGSMSDRYVESMRPAVTMPGYHQGREPANKGKKYPAEILTPNEVAALFDQISSTTSIGLRNRALITVLYRAGLRHSEALALRPKDVNLENGTIAVLHGKGDRSRLVGIDPGACQVIAQWQARRTRLGFGPLLPLFTTMQGRPLKSSYLKTLLPKVARQAGIEKRVHPHGLRHTHAFELMMEGVELGVIQRQLGHVSLATTAVYLNHIAPKQVIETMRKRVWKA